MRRSAVFVPRPSPGEFFASGDSMTYGQANTPGNSYREVTTRLLEAAGLRVTDYNGGHNGEYSADMVSRFATDVAANYTGTGLLIRGHACTTLAILSIGSNDAATGLSEATARSNQDSWINSARALGDNVIIGTIDIPPRIGSLGVSQSTFDAWILANNAYRLSQVGTLEDFHVVMPAELLDASDTADYPDGIHHSDAAALILGTAVAEAAIARIALT